MAIKDHPNYTGIVTLTASLIVNIKNKQAEYFSAKGKYFQGLRTPPKGKSDGEILKDIAYGLRPDDQPDSWNTFDPDSFKATTKLPYHIEINVYETPKDGWGWILRAELYYPGLEPDAYGQDGEHWVFQHNEGPETRSGIWDEWYIEPEIVNG